MKKTLDRSAQEVVEILTKFTVGEPTGFLADHFIHIPITDPALDEIRESFDRLAERYPQWEPQMPFPEDGAQELRILLERARSLATGQT